MKQQGRVLFSQGQRSSHHWPQLQLSSDSTTGWASVTDVEFHAARNDKPVLYGLIQKPFLSLAEDLPLHFFGRTGDYLDITSTTPEWRRFPEMNWETHQLVVPKSEEHTSIKHIALQASGPCHLFVITWHSGESARFGYCKDGAMAPTPIILGYLSPPDENGVSLTVLEVSGDDERVIEIDVPGRPSIPLKLQIRNK